MVYFQNSSSKHENRKWLMIAEDIKQNFHRMIIYILLAFLTIRRTVYVHANTLLMETVEIYSNQIVTIGQTHTTTECWLMCQTYSECEFIGRNEEEEGEPNLDCYLLSDSKGGAENIFEKKNLHIVRPCKECDEPAEKVDEGPMHTLVFDGLGENLPEVVKESPNLQEFTIAFWFNWTGGWLVFTMEVMPVTSPEACETVQLYSDDDESFFVLYRTEDGISSEVVLTVEKNVWNHVVISYSKASDYLTLHVNGSKINDYDKSSDRLPSGERIRVILGTEIDYDYEENKCVSYVEELFEGSIRQFDVWDKKLKDADIADIFNNVYKSNDQLIKWSEFNSTADVTKEFYIP